MWNIGSYAGSAGKVSLAQSTSFTQWTVSANYAADQSSAPATLEIVFEDGTSYSLTKDTQSYSGSGTYVLLNWDMGEANNFLVHYSIPQLEIANWHVNANVNGRSSVQLAFSPSEQVYTLDYQATFIGNASAQVITGNGDGSENSSGSIPLHEGPNSVEFTSTIVLIEVNVGDENSEVGIDYTISASG